VSYFSLFLAVIGVILIGICFDINILGVFGIYFCLCSLITAIKGD